MTPLIIGISGKAEHGKSASSRIMVEAAASSCLRAKIYEISDLILAHCQAIGLIPSGLLRSELNNDQVAMLVAEGHRMRIEVSPLYWTNAIFEVIDRDETRPDIAVIPNLRQIEEAKAVKGRKGCILRLNRLNANGSPFVSLTRDPNHNLETALDHWAADFYIVNVTGHGRLLEAMVATVFKYIIQLWGL